MQKTWMLSAVAGAAIASAAAAGVANGDIIFTAQDADGSNGAAIKLISGGGVSTLFQFGDDGFQRLSGIDRGPNGNFFVAADPFPIQNPSTAAVLEFSDLLGTPSFTTFVESDPIQRPTSLRYASATGSLLVVNSPAGPIDQAPVEALLQIGVPSGTIDIIHQDPPQSDPVPRTEAGVFIQPILGTNDYWVTYLNGGSVGGSDNAEASTIWRLNYDGVDSYNLSSSPVVNFADFEDDVNLQLGQIRGIASLPGTEDVAVTDFLNGKVWLVDIEAGSAVGVTELVSGLSQPEMIQYNPFTNQVIVSERGGDGFANARIASWNLDGSFGELLAEEFARDFYIIPTPGSAGLLALAGIAALRRRRG